MICLEAKTELSIAIFQFELAECDELSDWLAEEDTQLEQLTWGAQVQPEAYSSKSMMENIAMESTGRNDPRRRTRSREKRDF